MTDGIRWTRVLIEGVVIVGSILLAFGIDAGWDARDETNRRRAVVAGLQSDFQSAGVDLARVAGFHREGLSSAEGLMHLGSAGPVPVESSAMVDSLFAGVCLTASFDPPLGTLEALISSGDLDLLGDPELAVLLTSFPAMVADLDREQRFAREVMLLLFQYLGSEGLGFESFVTHPTWTVPWDLRSDGIFRVVHTQEFRGWVTLLWALYGNTTSSHRELDETIRRIESRLAAVR